MKHHAGPEAHTLLRPPLADKCNMYEHVHANNCPDGVVTNSAVVKWTPGRLHSQHQTVTATQNVNGNASTEAMRLLHQRLHVCSLRQIIPATVVASGGGVCVIVAAGGCKGPAARSCALLVFSTIN